MANFTIPYTTEANYTFDSDKIEIDSGIAKLKDLRTPTATFGATFSVNQNAVWGNGSLIGTLYGGASVSGGKLDLDGGVKAYVKYSSNNNLGLNTGTIKFKYTPNYSGIPPVYYWLFCDVDSSGFANSLTFSHDTTGRLRTQIRDGAGALIADGHFGMFLPTAGQEYEIEYNYSLTLSSSDIKVFVNGVRAIGDPSFAGLTRTNHGRLFFGCEWSESTNSNGKFDDILLFDTIQHTANYTPGYSVSDTIYSIAKPTIYKTLGDEVANIEEFISFDETLGSENEGLIRYQLSDDGITWLYWNGSIWATAGASDYNTEAECEANMLSFDPTADKIYVKAFLISNGSQKVELDENQVGYVINTAPSVYAGLNKTAIYNIATSPFSDCLFSDAEGNIVKAEWKEEGGSYVEISQGAYSTLLEAVQAFTNTFTHSGNKNVYLKITDSYDASTEDILIINVDRVNITINIQDENGNDLPNVIFDLGDGTGSAIKNSPFSHTAYIGSWTTIITKSGFDNVSEATNISTAITSLLFTMTREKLIDELEININAPKQYILGDSFNLDCQINTDLTNYDIRCEIADNSGNYIELATSGAGGSDSQIEVINFVTGEFLIKVAKNLTMNFSEKAIIEIEIENSNGEVRTIWQENIKFISQTIDWTTPSS